MNSVEKHLDLDLARLAAVEKGAAPDFRVWSTAETTVVVGRSVRIPEEVELDYCSRENIEIVRRSSGGRSVVVGPGTVQYSFTLPYRLDEELVSIPGAKRFCNRMLIAGLDRAQKIEEDASGDLTRGGRKFGGLALKRGKSAMLLHGTLLANADLEKIAAALRHPTSEPAYRGGRVHREFLTNFGTIDDEALEAEVGRLLLGFGELRLGRFPTAD